MRYEAGRDFLEQDATFRTYFIHQIGENDREAGHGAVAHVYNKTLRDKIVRLLNDDRIRR